ncbi:TetR/AcrR family transcriptional regulator [Paenibacillus sp. SYP-B4298]|uniref:TetR/AcrR family transcriptional regulator n=1 Tax=Paenibacillus sp. SYP-B4298 TaxID=2996034 RepID=UPI0022DE1A3F|nr:TetR family transcriptional regulator [Paenibacillus sp. SYP-B4298]
MSNKTRSATREARMNAILDAATELLVEKPTSSLHEIAEHAKIGIATLHRYVESREQLLLKLGLRAIEVVGETVRQIPTEEEELNNYIPRLIEALIPLGDKIHFLIHHSSLAYNSELEAAEAKLMEPLSQIIGRLQERGYFRQDMTKEWILNVMYWMLFVTWQEVQSGRLARNAAASLMLETVFSGVGMQGHSRTLTP